jgi:ribosome-associated protein
LATKKTGKGGTKSGGRAKTAHSKSTRSRARADEDAAARTLALAVANTALEHKALNVDIVDVRGKVDYSDFVVIMSGRSDRHVGALARHIEETLAKKGQRCFGVEGLPHASWLLLDYGSVVVHIFHEDTRGYYDLERLWMDAARVAVEDLPRSGS